MDHPRNRRRRSQSSSQLDEIIDSWGLTPTGDYPISQVDIREFHQLRKLKNEIEKRLDEMRATFREQLTDVPADIEPGALFIEAIQYWQQPLSRAALANIVGRHEADQIFHALPATRHLKLKVWENGSHRLGKTQRSDQHADFPR